MAGWSDLVRRAQPRLLNFRFWGTEGTDWGFHVGQFKDIAGDPVDFTGAAFTCKVLTDVDGSTVATWTVTGDSNGYLTGTLADSSTAGTATGATRNQGRFCIWYCVGTKSGEVVQFWGPSGSPFIIEAAG